MRFVKIEFVDNLTFRIACWVWPKVVGSPCSMSHHAKCARSFQVQSRQDNHLKKIFCASSHRCGLFVVWNNQHFSDAQHTTKEAKDSRIFKKTLFIFFFVFSTIFCKLNPFCKVPTSEYACRHAQIDLFTSRKWIRVGISTLQPLKVQGGQNSIFFSWFAKSKLEFSHRKRNFANYKLRIFTQKINFEFGAEHIGEIENFQAKKIIRLFELEFLR